MTSLGLLISPNLLFYQRYIRNDALILVFTTLMTLSLFEYMRTRRVRWLYVGPQLWPYRWQPRRWL